MAVDVIIDLPLDPTAAWRARHAVAAPVERSPDLRDVLVLLVSELVTAAVRDAPEGLEERLVLRQSADPECVRVELIDPRPGADWPVAGPGPDYGRQLLDSLSDRWGVRHGEEGTELWFEIDRIHADA